MIRGRHVGWSLTLGMLWLGIVLVPARWLTPERYSAYAAGLQAFGLVTAFIVGLGTLLSEGRDRRVDRVYSLHQELTSGAVDDAARRLSKHLMSKPSGTSFLRRYSRSELTDDPALASYPGQVPSFPEKDLSRILRFFERAKSVLDADSADIPSFVELIGRHAGWWNCIILPDDTKSRRALMDLATWCDDFVERHGSRHPHLRDWGSTRRSHFGSLQPWADDVG